MLSVLAAPPLHFRVEVARFGMMPVGGHTALGWELLALEPLAGPFSQATTASNLPLPAGYHGWGFDAARSTTPNAYSISG